MTLAIETEPLQPAKPRGRHIPCSPTNNISHIFVLPRRPDNTQDCLGIL
jgi:hypothetical protein